MKALIQNENGLLINGDSYTTPDTIRIDNTAYSFVVSANEDIIIGDTNSGYMTALNEDGDTGQSVDLPIQYDIDTTDLNGVLSSSVTNGDEVSTYLKTGDTSFNLAVTTAGTNDERPFHNTSGSNIADYPLDGEYVLVSFNATINSGIANGRLYTASTNTDVQQHFTVKEGLNEIISPVGTSASRQTWIYWDGTNEFDIEVTDWSVRQIINPNSYATYYDVDTKAFKTIDNPVGTTYNMTDSFSSYFTTDVPVTQADRSKLDANPNLIYDLWFGSTITGLSFTKANVINFIPATEGIDGGDTVTDISDVTGYVIQNYTDTCRTFYTDEVYGFQNILADQDGTGVITGMASLTTVDMIEPLRVRSPDGTVWIITVDDLGVVSAVEEV